MKPEVVFLVVFALAAAGLVIVAVVQSLSRRKAPRRSASTPMTAPRRQAPQVQMYVGAVPATDKQIEYIHILGGVPPPGLTMYQASQMIDELIQKRDEKESRYRSSKREEDELRMLASVEQDPSYKPRRSRSFKVRTLREFQHLVNEVISDNIIELDEVRALAAWLRENKRLPEEFTDELRLLSRVVLSKKIDDEATQRIYEALLSCLSQLRNRPAV